MLYFVHDKKGITPLELLVAVGIMGLAIGGVVAVYIMATTSWKETSAQISLQRKASIAMEKMVRGIDGTNGIREASEINIPNNTAIRFTSGIDAQERSFYLSGGEIMYDPNTSIANNEFSIAENVATPSGLTFAESNSVVTINLSVKGRIKDKELNVDLSTKAKLRN